MNLYTLLYGKSKKRMYPIMTDDLHKCENYRDARRNVKGWHTIVPADSGANVWRQKSATIGGNKCTIPRIKKNGVVQVAGYISKYGFNPHT